MKILIEKINPEDIETEVLTEGETGKKSYYLKGPFIVAESKNKNGRIYPASIIEREVSNFIKEKIEKNMAGGELNHPTMAEVNPERISHYITELKRDGNVWWGKAKVASTTLGKNIIIPLIEDGYRLGISTRGLGSVGKNGIVESDFRLVTADIVSNPSASGAFLDMVLEQKEYIIMEDGRIAEKAYTTFEKQLSSLPKGSVLREAHLEKAIKNFLRSIS